MAESDRIANALRYQQQMSKALPMEGRATFLPFQDTMPGSVMNQRSFALPGIVAGAVNAFTAPGRAMQGGYEADEAGNITPTFNAPEEAMNFATNVMGGGMAIGKAPAGSLGMNVTSKGRIPETGVDTRKLADMLERAGVKGGYEIAREGSAVSPSQYITFRNPADELATRQVRISNHADKYPELASGVRTSVDPATEVSFEQAVNWLAKEGYPTTLSKKYKNIPSWEQHYSQQQAARDANKLQGLIDAWRNEPKATRGPIPTEYDLLVKGNK